MMLTIISGVNACWSDTNHKTVTIALETVELGMIPFTASVDGPEAHVIDVYKRAVNGEFGPITEPEIPSLAGLRADAKASVDAKAEAYRLTFITGGCGQAMAYRQKLDEARAYLANTGLTAADCPHIFAEVGITGGTAEVVARVVLGKHAAWQVRSADIERQRLTAKAAIEAAETAGAIGLAGQLEWKA